MKRYDVIIVGGGAGGLFLASKLANSKLKVAVLEANNSLGKKILVTGNGRCNLTNVNMSSKYFNTNIDNFLAQFSEKDTLEYFKSIGLATYADDEGRVYPISNSAKSVVDVLTYVIRNCANIDIYCNEKVDNINIKTREVKTEKDTYSFSNLVIATGNIDNQFLNNFKCVSHSPSLVSLKTKESTKGLQNTRVSNVKITLGGYSEEGEILFKENGISGICVFNISAILARKKCFRGEVSIDLLPRLSHEKTITMLNNRAKHFTTLNDLFLGLFVDPIKGEILKRCKLNDKIKCNKLASKDYNILSKTIHNMTFNVCGLYDNNQVVSGGVDIKSLNDGLESKDNKGVYFIGEVCDVDGMCGGYNLQWAWTSASIVAKDLLQKNVESCR